MLFSYHERNLLVKKQMLHNIVETTQLKIVIENHKDCGFKI